MEVNWTPSLSLLKDTETLRLFKEFYSPLTFCCPVSVAFYDLKNTDACKYQNAGISAVSQQGFDLIAVLTRAPGFVGAIEENMHTHVCNDDDTCQSSEH